MTNPELNPAGTAYLVGKREVPRVTAILRALRLEYMPDDPAALARGQAVHLCARYLLENRLDWKSVDDTVVPFVKAAQKAIAELKIKPLAIERTVVSNLGYAGTPDLLCTFDKSPERAMLDWKSGKAQASAALQLVAYAGASSAAPIGRLVCELREDATYRIVAFPAANWFMDWRAWLGALSLYQWVRRQKKGATHGTPSA